MNDTGSNKNNSEQIKQDLKLSVLTGPLTFVIPIISYVFLYPIILSRSSLEVLGIWSLYVTTASFFTIADLGFSQHFMREAGGDRDRNILYTLKLEQKSARRFYLLLGAAGIIFIMIFRNDLFASVQDIYSPEGLFASAAILIVSTTFQLIGSLDAAILSANADNYYVRFIKSISPMLIYSLAILGALMKMPIEGFVTGSLVANLFIIIVYKYRLKNRHSDWFEVKARLPINQTTGTLKNLIIKGWKLFSASVGMIIRQPVLRYVIAFSLGLPAAGVFDIAMRVTSTSRDVVSTGFSSLFPSLSYFFRNDERLKIIEIIKLSLMILLPVGFIIAAVLIYNVDFIYTLWLGNIPAGLISATAILAVWQLITIMNIPFWFLLQAAYREKIAAVAVWSHTVFILLLIPAKILNINLLLNQFLIYWTITALFTQFLIYYFVEKKLDYFLVVIKNSILLKVLTICVAFFCIQIFLQNILGNVAINKELLTLLLISLFIAVLFPFFLPEIRKHLFLKKTSQED